MVGSLQKNFAQAFNLLPKPSIIIACMHANKLAKITCTKHAKGIENLSI